MAKMTQPFLCGVDVSLENLDIAQSSGGYIQISNAEQEICSWLDSLPSNACIAMEATNDYHEVLLQEALARDFEVYLVNAKQVHHYREAVNQRAKTDMSDAWLLLRYLKHERTSLEPVKSLSKKEKKLWSLLKKRAALVKLQSQAKQSLKGLPETEEAKAEVSACLDRQIQRLEKLMLMLVKDLGWSEAFAQCKSIPGIGTVNALGLVASFHRGDFRNADQFVAYLGLDVRVRDSGKFKGQRKLTKRGDGEMRRLLYNAAMSLARDPLYKPLYMRFIARGKTHTASCVILARKLVRVAYSLMSQGGYFEQERFRKACALS